MSQSPRVSPVPSPGSPLPPLTRPAQAADLAEVAEVIIESFHSPHSWLAWFSPVLKLGIYQDLRSRNSGGMLHYVCLVATEQQSMQKEKQLLGTVEVSLRLVGDQLPRSPYLSNLAVRPVYRRQGVAQHLLLACEQTVRQWGFEDLYLHVLEDNQIARELYRKAGYRLQAAHASWTSLFWVQPRQLLLHKRL